MSMVTVSWEGDAVALAYAPDEAILHLAIHARAVFGIKGPCKLRLCAEDGTELPWMKHAGDVLTPGQLLALRPPVVG